MEQHCAVNFEAKLIGWGDLPAWRQKMRETERRLVVTNGCFDLLHLGHVTYLEQAREQGDALLVGVNSDDAVRQLKGDGRPLNPENARASVVAALESVTGVCIFRERTAANFLTIAQPDIYVKGGDYTLETLNAEERQIVEKAGGRIILLPFVQGWSTTTTLTRMTQT